MQNHSMIIWCHVDDKRCGFDSECMTTIRWAPTDRQLADAFTKDSTDAVAVFRSCLGKDEYRLPPEQTMLQRAAAERERRKLRRQSRVANTPSSPSPSPQDLTVKPQQSERTCMRAAVVSQKKPDSNCSVKKDEWCSFPPLAATNASTELSGKFGQGTCQ